MGALLRGCTKDDSVQLFDFYVVEAWNRLISIGECRGCHIINDVYYADTFFKALIVSYHQLLYPILKEMLPAVITLNESRFHIGIVVACADCKRTSSTSWKCSSHFALTRHIEPGFQPGICLGTSSSHTA